MVCWVIKSILFEKLAYCTSKHGEIKEILGFILMMESLHQHFKKSFLLKAGLD
jgi:hypothetical protein